MLDGVTRVSMFTVPMVGLRGVAGCCSVGAGFGVRGEFEVMGARMFIDSDNDNGLAIISWCLALSDQWHTMRYSTKFQCNNPFPT